VIKFASSAALLLHCGCVGKRWADGADFLSSAHELPLEQPPILMILADEEAVNFKAANLLMEPLGLRGGAVPVTDIQLVGPRLR